MDTFQSFRQVGWQVNGGMNTVRNIIGGIGVCGFSIMHYQDVRRIRL